ncbi:HAMP domain-containing protein [Nitrogeniibacter mangrovi]|uniref:histidine kinase n=1 Tax=Nitrogeniibacter mangrovi TaxID=2016596 RepID=A0A6C1B309_9RHOO|nr:ATP-binding protein [Nitrogeniibacter mangrovi]QID16720.1 HAMP domain-containing protein [Nitrogeniibacter mangrovi]
MGRLFWKSFVAFWLALIIAGAGVGTAVWLHRQSSIDEAAERLAPRINFWLDTTEAVLADGNPQATRRLLMGSWRRQDGPPVLVIDTNGRELAGHPLPPPRALDDLPASARRWVTAADGRRYEIVINPNRLNRDRHSRQPPTPLIPIAAGLIASLGFSALLAWYVAKPIRALRRAFDAAARGHLETRVTPSMGGRRDEIADLGQDFDRMAARLQAQITAQRRLLHDVSHELRSPLARMQAAIGLGRKNPERREETFDRLERESQRLDTLVGELLTLARLEAGSNGHLERVELMEMLADISEDARFEAQAKGRDVVFAGEGEAWARVQATPLQRAFENVIRNAVKYTAEGTTVEVTVSRAGDRLTVDVADRGPGVPAADLPYIFEPFHRGSAPTAAPGFGLGLAIAKRALGAHDGQIEAMPRPGGGLRVRLTLPLNDQAQTR